MVRAAGGGGRVKHLQKGLSKWLGGLIHSRGQVQHFYRLGLAVALVRIPARPPAPCHFEGRPPILVAQARVGARVEQQPHATSPASHGGEHERSRASLGSGVHNRATAEQSRRAFGMSVLRSGHEWRASTRVWRLHVRPEPKQCCHHLCVSVIRRPPQRCVLSNIYARVWARPLCDQSRNHVGVALSGRGDNLRRQRGDVHRRCALRAQAGADEHFSDPIGSNWNSSRSDSPAQAASPCRCLPS